MGKVSKKAMTKSMAIILVVSLCLTLLPSISSQAEASDHTQAEAVSWASSQIGKSIGSGQCTALLVQYYRWLGEEGAKNNASDYPNQCPSDWEKIPYGNGFHAQPGDVAVWSHTSVVARSGLI